MEHTGAYLVIQQGSLLGKRVELWKERTTIGRSRECDIFLEDLTVHRKQASILRTPTGYLLRDDHGNDDSFVNGRVVKEQVLQDGDQLLFGNTRLTFHANEGTRPFQMLTSRRRELHIAKTPDPLATSMAGLEMTDARGSTHKIDLLPQMTIGRSRDCSIFLQDLSVSRVHATICELPDGTHELVDNRSATGTFVNKRAVVRCILHEGDVIQIGGTMFTFHHG
ncbi:MAG: FHA domain-containing protein [Ktedonobacteraceae bacterium]|nr:FHA domain-containing protein [Ktedonobacteraceae bacterium]